MAATATAADAPPAVNLRDIGEVCPSLLKARTLYRCSQIYTPDVLRELKIRTVVDLRGRAEKKKKHKHHHGGNSSSTGGREQDIISERSRASTDQATATPLLDSAALERLQRQHERDSMGARGTESMELDASGPEADVIAIQRQSSGSDTDSDTGSRRGGATADQKATTVELAGGLAGNAGAEGAFGEPGTLNFNLIPAKEFGLTMLRMPRRVWWKSVTNLVSGRDPRKPFVEAFADEQLLGFTRYYIIILEHARPNIAAVMRVFTNSRNLPALVHCAHGKDRTGVVIMLLLLLCGVPHDQIVDDYVQSEIELRRYRVALGLEDPSSFATAAAIPLSDIIIASTAETLRAVLLYVDDRYGGVANYLASCGVSQSEMDTIRRNLMKDASKAPLLGGGAQRPQPVSGEDVCGKVVTEQEGLQAAKQAVEAVRGGGDSKQ